MSYSVGALVRARGREWVVLPGSGADLLHLRPLGRADDEVTAILPGLERIESAQFALPDPQQLWGSRSAGLPRRAAQLGFRASAGPFRSFARINVEPRPYQLAPLLMALKMQPARLLIADDVGIGKTIEALLIARELLDRGEINRMAVLCPPQLAEQWQREMIEKFHIDAELALSSTAARLERRLRAGQSIFERHSFTVVSTDFIKSERRRHEFLRDAPELVIVDEAHSVAHAYGRGGGSHQRFELVKRIAEDAGRHLLLVTATPHSGKQDAFRALLTLLQPRFAELPSDLRGRENGEHRRDVARYFVQRRRADIQNYLRDYTDFPERVTAEDSYELSDAYKRLFDRALRYAREIVDVDDDGYRRRVRWWSALALLRSMASSPAAAAATLRSRAATTEPQTQAEVDEIGRRAVLDQIAEDAAEANDVVPGSDIWPADDQDKRERQRLLNMAREAERLQGEDDQKLRRLIAILKDLLEGDYQPIVFCRFIPTVGYLQSELRKALPGIEIRGVTGQLPPAERERRVADLARGARRLLVCTDCLSEGINLQHAFDAVAQYDLSWNPTRHEQREGRVDRYGQPRKRVKVVTYYGIDNQIDGIVLDVLLRKHKSIRDSLGVSVSMPGNSEQIIEALFEGLLLRENASFFQSQLPGFERHFKPIQDQLDLQWENLAAREKASRTMFAQQGISVDQVAKELEAARDALGGQGDLAAFTRDALRLHGATVQDNGLMRIDLSESPRSLRDALGKERFCVARDGSAGDCAQLTRTRPIVESLANYVLNSALDELDPQAPGARRAGVMRSRSVATRSTLLLLRLRFHIVTQSAGRARQLLAEDSLTVAFEGAPAEAAWLDEAATEALLQAEASANVHPKQAASFVGMVIDGFAHIAPMLDELAERRGHELLAAHLRVRQAAGLRQRDYPRVEAQLPPDALGIYVYMPGGA